MSEYSTFKIPWRVLSGRAMEMIVMICVFVVRRRECRLTSYRPHLLRVLASNEEDNVPLAGVDIVVLEEEELVDAVFLESAELDEQSNGAGQRALDDEVLLASDLSCG